MGENPFDRCVRVFNLLQDGLLCFHVRLFLRPPVQPAGPELLVPE